MEAGGGRSASMHRMPWAREPLDALAVGRNAGAEPAAQSITTPFDAWIDRYASCPWVGHAGLSPWGLEYGAWIESDHGASGYLTPSSKKPPPLYTASERARRDASPWTMVQAVLAPLQFAICAASLLLIVRYLTTGQGYALATGSILLKTIALYAIMITGSIWEKEVFGRWLFAPAFFWEDAVSMVVLGLQTTYVAALFNGWGTPGQQMTIAIAAYAAYALNASQFLLKLRAARLSAAPARALAA